MAAGDIVLNGNTYSSADFVENGGYGYLDQFPNPILSDMLAEMQIRTEAVAGSLQASSSTSLAIGTGSKTLTIEVDKGFSAGSYVVVYYDSANYMIGTVTSYNSSTGELIINVPADHAIGSGTLATWSVAVCGFPLPASGTGPNFVTSPTVPDPGAGDNSTKVPPTSWVNNAIAAALPTGVITMWSGAIAAVPTGWVLCDGANGTPDLRGRFVIGADDDAGGNYDVDDTGDGSIPSHSHSFSDTSSSSGSHDHQVQNYNGSTAGGSYKTIDTDSGNLLEPAGSGTFLYKEDLDVLSTDGSHSHSVSGTTGATGTGAEVIAKHYALAYIMKS